jgi:hypothetical protein
MTGNDPGRLAILSQERGVQPRRSCPSREESRPGNPASGESSPGPKTLAQERPDMPMALPMPHVTAAAREAKSS